MTVYKVGNIYYNQDSLAQYIDQNHSFSNFLLSSLSNDETGNVRGLVNTIYTVLNSDQKNEVVKYLEALNYLYVGYVNNVISNIPHFTVLEGGNKDTPTESESEKNND